jgi:hypothetical protein
MQMKLATRFKIVGVEVVGLGAFLLAVLILELSESHGLGIVQNFSWDYGIIGTTLILVGSETISLIKYLPDRPSSLGLS